MKEHKKLVFELAKPGKDIVDELTPMQAFALHMAIGVSGEAGERRHFRGHRHLHHHERHPSGHR